MQELTRAEQKAQLISVNTDKLYVLLLDVIKPINIDIDELEEGRI